MLRPMICSKPECQSRYQIELKNPDDIVYCQRCRAALIHDESNSSGGSGISTVALDPNQHPDLINERLSQTVPYSGSFDLPSGTLFAGRYLIEEKLGRGGMGVVFRATDQILDRSVAIKIPHPEVVAQKENLKRFVREARIAAGFNHRNLCPVLDCGIADGIHYFTMPLIKGVPLSSRLEHGPLDPWEAARSVLILARAIQSAHEAGVIHRDLKPANIMMSPGIGPVVMDFGLARVDSQGDSVITRPGAMIGTPYYMAPEQIEAETELVTQATDIYALGVVFYEMITGIRPHRGNVASVLVRIQNEEPTPPSELAEDLDPVLEAICLKAMAKSVTRRYESMDELADALEAYLEQSSNGSKKRNRKQRTRPEPRLRPADFRESQVGRSRSFIYADRADQRLAADSVRRLFCLAFGIPAIVGASAALLWLARPEGHGLASRLRRIIIDQPIDQTRIIIGSTMVVLFLTLLGFLITDAVQKRRRIRKLVISPQSRTFVLQSAAQQSVKGTYDEIDRLRTRLTPHRPAFFSRFFSFAPYGRSVPGMGKRVFWSVVLTWRNPTRPSFCLVERPRSFLDRFRDLYHLEGKAIEDLARHGRRLNISEGN